MIPRYRKFQIVGIAGALLFSAVVLTDFSETNILSSSNAIDHGLSKFVATISTDSVETFWITGSGSGGEFEGNESVKTTAENSKAPATPTI